MKAARGLEVLREDNRAIIRAASAASKAADYLLAFRDRDPAPQAANKRARLDRVAQRASPGAGSTRPAAPSAAAHRGRGPRWHL
jgi:hypothetical protein